jgi:ketosteroid isomerase-like protein
MKPLAKMSDAEIFAHRPEGIQPPLAAAAASGPHDEKEKSLTAAAAMPSTDITQMSDKEIKDYMRRKRELVRERGAEMRADVAQYVHEKYGVSLTQLMYHPNSGKRKRNKEGET